MGQNVPIELGWFIRLMEDEEILPAGSGLQLLGQMPGERSIENFAQYILDTYSSDLSESDAAALMEAIQRLAESAMERAASGEAAQGMDVAVESEASIPQVDVSNIGSYQDIPSLSDTATLDDAGLRERMALLLASLRQLGCSDLHINGGACPFVRRQLLVERIDGYVLTAEDSRRLNMSLLDEEQRARFDRDHDLAVALDVNGSRFRACFMDTKDGMVGSYRLISNRVMTLEELGFLPGDAAAVARLLDYNNGLILVTGNLGAGKTSTLASMTAMLNERRRDHIISVEDPIEVVQSSRNCQITQREIGHHTASYSRALKAALREDPDIIIIGEMRDLETIENAITASETGHLVVGTMHTGDASNTMNRLLDVFPPAQQSQIRAMTSVSLRGIVCQKLIPNGMGGIVMVYEILLNTMSVANLISEGKSFQLKSTMAVSRKQGMCTFDQCLFEKFLAGQITRDAALPYMTDQSVISELNSQWAIREAAAR